MMALELRGTTEPHVAVICDEVSRFITPDLAVALAELRGYGCSMTLAAQSLCQLSTQERQILETVLGCSETLISFRVQFADALRMAQEMMTFDPHLVKDEIYQTKSRAYLEPRIVTTMTPKRIRKWHD